jgi:hypothetical protein
MATQDSDPMTNSSEGEKRLESSSTTERNGSTQEGTLLFTAEREYVKGIKLILVLASATLATFLMMLDMTLIATVRSYIRNILSLELTASRQFLVSRTNFIRLLTSDGTAVHTHSRGISTLYKG